MKETPEPKLMRSRFQKHVSILIWKAYIQRQRRWRLLLLHCFVAFVLFALASVIARPVFLTPLQTVPEPPLTSDAILKLVPPGTILGYTPNSPPYDSIMQRAGKLLDKEMLGAPTSHDLDKMLFLTKGNKIRNKVIFVLWSKQVENVHKFQIRSTEVGRLSYGGGGGGRGDAKELRSVNNPHLQAGFLSVQLAVSQALLESASTPEVPNFQLSLVAMPVSPLMDKTEVKRVISLILMCFTLALLPPVLETESLVVKETQSRLKRALRLRNVAFSSMYLGWLSYAIMTALPVVFLGAITMILIFRWIHVIAALFTLLMYTCVMIVMSMIMAMFHSKAKIACIWTTLLTLLQTLLAELMVHHHYTELHAILQFFLHMFLPPLGLVHALNHFALLQTGSDSTKNMPVRATLVSWGALIVIFFMLLMLMQRTVSRGRAIGGQQSWKSIIFKKAEDKHAFRPIETLTGDERKNLQPVEEFVAKAISFRNVHKEIMGIPVLSGITFDIYRCEFTMLFGERIQNQMMTCVEDLITGLTYADSGTVYVLGEEMKPGGLYPMNTPHMMGYCDQSEFLIDDLTVDEHLVMYMDLCLWHISTNYVIQYKEMRFKRLLHDCDLKSVRFLRVRDLDVYYRAQLCWALAILLEPKVIVLPNFVDHPTYMAVITDKIIQYKKFTTIVKISYANIKLENADRVFVFDNRVLSFGGTPAYMFFKYGRDYRLRLNLKSGGALEDDSVKQLLEQAAKSGATIRSHLGSLLILRVPTSPTANVAELVKELQHRANQYGIVSMNISLPDSEEIFRRCIYDSRPSEQRVSSETTLNALKRIAEPKTWKVKQTMFSNMTHIRMIAWKYFSFYTNYKVSLVITIMSAVLVGIFMGLSMSTLIREMLQDHTTKQLMEGQVLTVEALSAQTTLVLRVEEIGNALTVAHGYVLSEANATSKQVQKITYTALPSTESLTEYLVTKAIDSPDFYVFMYAYGIDIASDSNGSFVIQVLYSPMHHDHGAAARSLARAYTALLRYYTGKFDASIEVTDYPLLLEITPWMKKAETPPLFIQFLLVLTISHITLIPSNEYGLIRHFQSHALNFSPARYWISLFFCDIVHYWLLVGLMCGGVVGVMLLIIPTDYFDIVDLLSIPFMLVVYGLGCVPQAYLFSLGPRAMLNSMAFVIVNIVFGEATIVAKLFYRGVASSSLDFMVISPQYNVAYALVKIKTTFLYNSECILFKLKKELCDTKILHKCCAQCGVLQPCFERKSYWLNIRDEIIGCIGCFVLFASLLFLWEYRVVQRGWRFILYMLHRDKYSEIAYSRGLKERVDVEDKEKQIRAKNHKNNVKIDTFGEYLLAVDVSLKRNQHYLLHNVFLGLGRGETLAVSGLKRHGRDKLCELLAGYKNPGDGRIWTMSKYKLNTEPHMYCRNVTICCERHPLPGWMTVYDALELVAILRGVPKKHVMRELQNIIEALDLSEKVRTQVNKLPPSSRKRLHFAAAVIGAPPVVVLDQCTAYQSYSVRRAMYHIIYHLRRNGHAILISDSNVEGHMPVSNRLAILLDGHIADIDSVDRLLARYSDPGYTVVVHLKRDLDVRLMFARYFKQFLVNDISEVLVNMQVLDELNWADIFTKMEKLKAENTEVQSYIVCAIPIDYIYNSIQAKETGLTPTSDFVWCNMLKGLIRRTPKVTNTKEQLDKLQKFSKKYDITTLKELPWSVIFHT